MASLTFTAVTGHRIVLNLSNNDNVAKVGFRRSNFLKKQLRSLENMGHSTKKWYSVSTGANGGGGEVGPILGGGGGNDPECVLGPQ